MSYKVYVIGLDEDVAPPYNNCYVGVTSNMDRRWKMHAKSRYMIGRFIRFYDLQPDKNMHEIFSGSREQCFCLELELRPRPFMGLNEARGGCGGDTGLSVPPPKWSYTPERAKKISKALSGIPKTKEHVQKIVDARDYTGSKNPRAKRWVLRSPEGIEYYAHGNLRLICDQLNILESCLRYYKDTVVPEAKMSDNYGGYRPKNQLSMEKRMNTEGWKLSEVVVETQK